MSEINDSLTTLVLSSFVFLLILNEYTSIGYIQIL